MTEAVLQSATSAPSHALSPGTGAQALKGKLGNRAKSQRPVFPFHLRLGSVLSGRLSCRSTTAGILITRSAASSPGNHFCFRLPLSQKGKLVSDSQVTGWNRCLSPDSSPTDQPSSEDAKEWGDE